MIFNLNLRKLPSQYGEVSVMYLDNMYPVGLNLIQFHGTPDLFPGMGLVVKF